MKKIVIFNQRVAGYLMLKGYPLRKIDKSNKVEHKNIFIFDDSEELRDSIARYDNFISVNRDYLLM